MYGIRRGSGRGFEGTGRRGRKGRGDGGDMGNLHVA